MRIKEEKRDCIKYCGKLKINSESDKRQITLYRVKQRRNTLLKTVVQGKRDWTQVKGGSFSVLK